MGDFKIHTLGCGSAKPSRRHLPSCTVVEHRGSLYMVDCGEGAQRSMQLKGLGFSRLGHIFLTHLHGDHVLGLPGLVGTLGLQHSGGTLTIHTFEEGKKILEEIFGYFCRDLGFDIIWDIVDPRKPAVILDTKSLTVRTVPLNHRVPCVGYVFEEKEQLRHLDRASADFYGVPMHQYNNVKAGADFIKPDGTVVANRLITKDPTPPLSYAHISDTAYMPRLAEQIKGISLLFHETTYLEDRLCDAAPRGHSTAKQAATVARDAEAKALLTGHYSSRYKDDEGFRQEALQIFNPVILNREGLTVDLSHLPEKH